MPDITMCERHDCPKKEQCLRYMAEPDGHQYYFKPPEIGDDCEFFMPLINNWADEFGNALKYLSKE
jgi:hypothetical protein